MQGALIFANGEAGDGPMVSQALAHADNALIIAADGGARIAHFFGFSVQYVIGDMDSLSDAELAALRAEGAQIQQYPEEKDETDLELALMFAAQQGAGWIRILGAAGNRIDQTLGNIYLLGLPQLADLDVRIVAVNQQTWLLRTGENRIQGAVGDTLSLIPLSDTVHGVRTEHLYYPLEDETLTFGPARGMSNVLQADEVCVWVGEGRLLAVHTTGRA